MGVRRPVALSLAILASGCASARTQIADAESAYVYAYGEYNVDCRTAPRQRSLGDCQRFYRELLDTRQAIQKAAEAEAQYHSSKAQRKALKDSLSALQKEVR